MKIEIISSEKDFTALQQDWNTLQKGSADKSIFLTWDWMHTWWDAYKEKLNDPRLHIVTFYRQDKLAAILPLFSHKKKESFGPLRCLQFLGTEFESSDYLDIIGAADVDNDEWVQALKTQTFQQLLASADMLIVSNAFAEARIASLFATILANRPAESRRTSVCPYLPLPESEEILFKQLSKNMKSTLRRTRNKINKDPDFSIGLVERSGDIPEAIEGLFRLHAMRFDDKNQATKFVAGQRGDFHKRIAARWLEQERLRFYTVTHRQKAIGFLYCYYYNHKILYMQAGFHPEYGKYGLGNQLMLRAMNDGMNSGADEFDFMRGNESYKYKWTSLFRELYTTRYALNRRAARHIRLQAALGKAKALVKKLIRKR